MGEGQSAGLMQNLQGGAAEGFQGVCIHGLETSVTCKGFEEVCGAQRSHGAGGFMGAGDAGGGFFEKGGDGLRGFAARCEEAFVARVFGDEAEAFINRERAFATVKRQEEEGGDAQGVRQVIRAPVAILADNGGFSTGVKKHHQLIAARTDGDGQMCGGSLSFGGVKPDGRMGTGIGKIARPAPPAPGVSIHRYGNRVALRHVFPFVEMGRPTELNGPSH